WPQKEPEPAKRKTAGDFLCAACGFLRRIVLMLWLYRLLFVPVLLVLAPAYLSRMWRRGGYGSRFGERFGAHPQLPPPQASRPRVWLQAVSVGEMLAIGPLLEALHRDGVEVYLTTTTSTGFRLAQE